MHIFHPARADGGLDAAHVTLVTQFPPSPLPALQKSFYGNRALAKVHPLVACAKIYCCGRIVGRRIDRLRSLAKISFLTALFALATGAVKAQDSPSALPPSSSVPFPEEATKNASAPCL